MDIIIKNGTIVTASDTYAADIGIKNGRIVQIAETIEQNSETTIDAAEQYVLPGIIDAHVHCQLPMAGTVSADDFNNASKAAACGGVTTIIDYATQEVGKSLMAAIQERQQLANGQVCIDYALHAGITDWAIAKNEIDQAFTAGISSFKMFMTYIQRGLMSTDAEIFEALEQTSKRGGVVAVHAESSPLLDLLVERYQKEYKKYGVSAHSLSRPDIVEIEAVERAIRLAELSGGTLYIVHMTTGQAVEAVRQARARGVKVYGETCPQYLLLDDSIFERAEGYLYTSCPQIKSKENQQRLWQGVRNGDIQVIATDTCTFTKKQKNLWQGDFTKLPFGLPGVETLFSLMHNFAVGKGHISLNHLVALLSYNPAKIYGLYPRKGTIAIGSDADITILDPHREVIIDYENLQTNCDWSPYQAMLVKGYPSQTISNGKVVARDGKFVGQQGNGRYLKRWPTQPLS